jgi:hypothetical protein
MAFSVRRSEQLSTVAQSDVLIGMHGAGITHLGKQEGIISSAMILFLKMMVFYQDRLGTHVSRENSKKGRCFYSLAAGDIGRDRADELRPGQGRWAGGAAEKTFFGMKP